MGSRIPIILAPELRIAIYGKCHDEEISEIYAVQQCVVRQMYQEKRLSRENYEALLNRFSLKLKPSIEQKPLSGLELQEKQKLDEQRRYFASLLSQWDLHKDNLVWVERNVNYAVQYKDVVSDAAHVIELGDAILRNHVLFNSSSQSLCDRDVKKHE